MGGARECGRAMHVAGGGTRRDGRCGGLYLAAATGPWYFFARIPRYTLACAAAALLFYHPMFPAAPITPFFYRPAAHAPAAPFPACSGTWVCIQ